MYCCAFIGYSVRTVIITKFSRLHTNGTPFAELCVIGYAKPAIISSSTAVLILSCLVFSTAREYTNLPPVCSIIEKKTSFNREEGTRLVFR